MQNKTEPEFVIWAPPFDPDSGGVIALHYLCYKLRKLGKAASIWPADNQMPTRWIETVPMLARNAYRRREFAKGPFGNPLASPFGLTNKIVIYPEIVSGNPLHGKRVIRWFLNTKGFFDKSVSFTDDELEFFYQSYFDDNQTVSRDRILRIRWIREDIYYEDPSVNRTINCQMVRKREYFLDNSKNKFKDHVMLDGKSHAEIAPIFRQSKHFICHDPYTMYAFYAALCGCIPVIIPIEGKSEIDWRAREEDRWGLAYGFDRIDWAISTREKMLDRFQREKNDEDLSVKRFVEAAIAWKD